MDDDVADVEDTIHARQFRPLATTHSFLAFWFTLLVTIIDVLVLPCPADATTIQISRLWCILNQPVVHTRPTFDDD